MASSRDSVYATVYSPTLLTWVYDYYVLGFNLRYVWGCPTDAVLLPFFAENFSRRHLDVGVATGYLPAKVLASPWRRAAAQRQHLTLLDISGNSLRASEARVCAAAPGIATTCVEADVVADLPPVLSSVVEDERARVKKAGGDGGGSSSSSSSSSSSNSSCSSKPCLYDSISMFNLFHCVPGGPAKLRAISTYKTLLADHGVLSGCTVLGERHATGWFSRWYLRLYNRKGIFNNINDTREEFEEVLNKEFEEVDTIMFGMVLLFRASRPRREGSGYVDLLD
ncbi:hypothetical protein PpBr36_08330 [Pyricularia pennisetigena]|uniref:hypothetical protein n=1 Tax=Pyricularia pennisetigena TaxID=1578925 RepID=UPI00114F4B15|nr:hypothetical protein PpBr36_08330 [Pyricularia pennisetigena]TLS24632.1 hypothetical protein PpBr36_08330 [Pyricularia pennisetigena]